MENSVLLQPIHPIYGAGFRCIGAACEDTCCQGFAVPVDRRTYEHYQTFKQPELAALAARYVTLNPTPAAADSLYAKLDLLPSGACAFLTEERLCGIQVENGPGALCATCSIYPRTLNTVDESLEVTLNLSCPEAARSVLLNDGLLKAGATATGGWLPGLPGDFRTDQSSQVASMKTCPIHKPWQHFDPIRELILAILRDRKDALARRLFLLGSLSRTLSGIATTAQDETVPGLLAVYRSIVAQPEAGSTEDGNGVGTRLCGPSAIQLELVLQLSALRLQEGAAGERFRVCFEEFQQGIGYGLDSTAAADLQRFCEVEQAYCRPFFLRHPYILENFLVNSVLKTLFPFGRAASAHSTPMSIGDEYLLLLTQFAWVHGLLTGVAGVYEQRFGTEEVIRTIQSYSKAVEHHPGFLLRMVAFAKARCLDTPEGVADLLQC